MNAKITGAILLGVVIIAAGFYVLAGSQPDTSSGSQYQQGTSTEQSQGTTTHSSSAGTGSAASGYTLADVAAHNSASSCWSAINGKVYNLTSWINQHPGGPDAILSICGKDGSSAFNQQHGGQRRPENELTNFYIGDLHS